MAAREAAAAGVGPAACGAAVVLAARPRRTNPASGTPEAFAAA
jgi:hypothetical protein